MHPCGACYAVVVAYITKHILYYTKTTIEVAYIMKHILYYSILKLPLW